MNTILHIVNNILNYLSIFLVGESPAINANFAKCSPMPIFSQSIISDRSGLQAGFHFNDKLTPPYYSFCQWIEIETVTFAFG